MGGWVGGWLGGWIKAGSKIACSYQAQAQTTHFFAHSVQNCFLKFISYNLFSDPTNLQKIKEGLKFNQQTPKMLTHASQVWLLTLEKLLETKQKSYSLKPV